MSTSISFVIEELEGQSPDPGMVLLSTDAANLPQDDGTALNGRTVVITPDITFYVVDTETGGDVCSVEELKGAGDNSKKLLSAPESVFAGDDGSTISGFLYDTPSGAVYVIEVPAVVAPPPPPPIPAP